MSYEYRNFVDRINYNMYTCARCGNVIAIEREEEKLTRKCPSCETLCFHRRMDRTEDY